MLNQTAAIIIEQHGNTDVLNYKNIDLSAPNDNEVQIKHTAIGVNFIDTYHRTGLYPVPLPSVLGLEAVGEIIATGKNVNQFEIGDKVAYGNGPLGAYSAIRNMPANRINKLPDSIKDSVAASIMLKGMTSWYLLRQCYAVKKDETILFHAAAGGVGQIACQWANALGANVIGTVGSDEKADIAKQNGCSHVINYNTENVVDRVKEITDGKGVPVVYDGVGKDTFETSLDCLQARGLLVSFGNASGPVSQFNLGVLAAKGSLFVTRPTLAAYVSSDADLQSAGNEVFEMVSSGKINIAVNHSYPLKEAALAHQNLEQRKTTGASILIP